MSKYKLIGVFIFGALCGGAASTLLVRRKYERIIEEDDEHFTDKLIEYKKKIASLEEERTKAKGKELEAMKETVSEKKPALKKSKNLSEKSEYEEVIKQSAYASSIPAEKTAYVHPKKKSKATTNAEYKEVTLDNFNQSKLKKEYITYYSDGVMASDGFKIDNTEELFGEIDEQTMLEKGEVYFINEYFQTAYDIQYDARTFEEAEMDGEFT